MTTATRYSLTITNLDGSVSYDMTSPSAIGLAAVQAQYNLMVNKARSGNIMFSSFRNVESVKVEIDEVFAA